MPAPSSHPSSRNRDAEEDNLQEKEIPEIRAEKTTAAEEEAVIPEALRPQAEDSHNVVIKGNLIK
jgi:hypothetical protein